MENKDYVLQEKIQSFVTDDLDQAARDALLDQSAADANTADELAFGQSLVRALRHREMAAAAAILSAVIATEGFPPPAPPIRWGPWVIGSVVLVLLVTVGYFWAASNDVLLSASQKMAKSALEPLENVLFLPDKGEGIAALQMGMADYDARRYPEAVRSLTRYTAQYPDAATKVYLGVSHLLSGKAKLAIAPLEEAALSPEPPVQEAARWYLALAYLADGHPDTARKLLESIPAEGIFGAQARRLEREINMLN